MVKKGGQRATCMVCGGARRNAITPKELGELLDPIVREHFRLGEHIRVFTSDDDDYGSWEQQGDDLSYVIQTVLGQYFEFEDEIVEAMVEAEGCYPPDGEESFYDSTNLYKPTGVQIQHYYAEWDYLLESLKHKSRFFNNLAQEFFDRIFLDIDAMVSWQPGNGAVSVVRELPVGTEIYRARSLISDSRLPEISRDPLSHVGPPPADLARAGRMNADGIVVLYGAMDFETCLAEIRPAIGGKSVLIRVKTTEPLRLLDFTMLDSAFRGGPLSYFQPDFTEQVERKAFIRKLHSLISQPITPGNESAYLITQTMAEYLAHSHRTPFDGILFSSVQRSGGVNIVLFPRQYVASQSAANLFPISYVQNSLQVFSTEIIQYSHKEMRIVSSNGELHFLNDYDYNGF